MKINYIKAKNFLCIGEEQLHLRFADYGNIVVIKGHNLDVGSVDDAADSEFFSNGSGKSTISEVLVYSLYGKPIRKKVSHAEAINVINKKKLEVEVGFTLHNKQYRIVRTRKPDTLRFWEGDDEITLGGQPATQQLIENTVGLNHKAFINVACFGQHNSYNFLDCDLAEQRNIVESVLALEVYKSYSDRAKDDLKNLKQEIKELLIEYENRKKHEDNCVSRINQIKQKEKDWIEECKSQIVKLENSILILESKLGETDDGQNLLIFEHAQQQLKEIQEAIPGLKDRKLTVLTSLEPAKHKFDTVRTQKYEQGLEFKAIQQQIKDIEEDNDETKKEIENLLSLKEGAQCPCCYSKIQPCNYKHLVVLKENQLDANKNKIATLKLSLTAQAKLIETSTQNIDKLKDLIDNADQLVKKIDHQLDQHNIKLTQLNNVKKPNASSDVLVAQEKLLNVKETLSIKKVELAGGGPYKEILFSTQEELDAAKIKSDECKAKIGDKEDLIPYYEYWVKAFGDDGIRSFVIEGIVPALNARIAYWLKVLINGKLKLTFNKHLDTCLERVPSNGDPFVYNVTCGGEKNRIDLAISQAFAHIVTLSSGTRPSLVFLDEIGRDIDRRGIADIYKMICELSAERQVFVITHDASLLSMLEGADTITVRKENGVSTILKE